MKREGRPEGSRISRAFRIVPFESLTMRILIIEDDAETAAYVVDGLKRKGHAADHVSDGRDGLMQASAKTYDAIVIDWMLPGLDGLAIVKKI